MSTIIRIRLVEIVDRTPVGGATVVANPAKSAKPPSPGQIRTAPPILNSVHAVSYGSGCFELSDSRGKFEMDSTTILFEVSTAVWCHASITCMQMPSVVEMLACPSCSCAIFAGTRRSLRRDECGGADATSPDRLQPVRLP